MLRNKGKHINLVVRLYPERLKKLSNRLFQSSRKPLCEYHERLPHVWHTMKYRHKMCTLLALRIRLTSKNCFQMLNQVPALSELLFTLSAFIVCCFSYVVLRSFSICCNSFCFLLYFIEHSSQLKVFI